MLWRMPEMVAPRALVFRPLVKGNEALGTRLVLFMILPCGFVQADALKLGVLPMKVHPAPCCGHHCFYAMLSVCFGIVNSPSSVTVGSSLNRVVQTISIPLDRISCR